MNTLKKALSLFLTAALLLSVLPSAALHVRAEESEQLPEEVEIETVEASQDVVPSADLPEPQELYDGYVTRLFYDNGVSFLGESAREQLGAQGQPLYDYLKENLLKIAAGEVESTVITITAEQIAAWGGSTEYIVESAYTALSNFKETMEVENVINALLHDCPYELYWYDKVSGVREVGSFRVITGGYKITSVRFQFAVAGNYQPEDYDANAPTFDTGFIQSASAAAANARSAVENNAGNSDYEKLKAYKDRICELVGYNSTVSSGSFSTDDDPWQLIYVFDGDPATNVVCEGYAKAFQYLCDETAFSGDTACYTVSGNMSGGIGSGAHMWNIVTLEGSNYLADITNSDSGTAGHDGSRFLAGGDGSILQGYTFGSSVYTYDTDTLALWGSGEESILNLAQSSYGAASGGDEEGSSSQLPFSSNEWEVLKLVNTERYAEGVNPLTGFGLLQQATDTRALELLEYYSHNRPDGTSCFTVLSEVGIRSYSAAGENIAMGYTTPAGVMNGWMNSSGHRANILSTNYTNIGIGCENTSWVQMFVGKCSYSSFEVVVPKSSYAGGTSIEDMGIYAVLGSNVYGKCYLPILSVYCTGYDPTKCESQKVTVSALGFTKTIEIPISGHDVYVNGAVAATCTETGLTEGKYCNVCKETLTQQEEIPALGHEMGQWEVVTEATCTASGGERRDCTRCDHYETRDIEAEDHDPVIVAAVAATCTETGLTEGKYCNVCKETLTQQEKIPALGHEMGQWEVVTEATCTASGEERRDCTRCDHYETRDIEAEGHHPVIDAEVTATCTETGLTRGSHCTICNAVLEKQETIAAKGHSYEPTVTAATCVDQGYTTYTCSACGDSYKDNYKDATGEHSYANDTDSTCEICGHVREVKIETTPMYRLYNPNSGEHFYTGSIEERENLVTAGWNYEGIAWNAPTKSGDPVYRVYNPNSGDHHYTMSWDEVNMLTDLGWKYEGVAWNSASSDNVPQYRLYNPNADCGSHHYTSSTEERDFLVSLGWIFEGIGWYGIA